MPLTRMGTQDSCRHFTSFHGRFGVDGLRKAILISPFVYHLVPPLPISTGRICVSLSFYFSVANEEGP